MLRAFDSRRPGFTIVELLVVIGIIAVLIGLLLPALSGVRRRGMKVDEQNNLRQVGVAWNLYANQNSDAALPGFMDTAVQQVWDVTYRYPGKIEVPPAPGYSAGSPNIAGPWSWRLAPFFDYNHDVLHGYANEADADMMEITSNPAGVEAQEIAYEPAFAYNGYYVGGYWEMVDMGGNERPMPMFATATETGTNRRPNLIARNISSIRRSTEVIVFCSAAELEPGIYAKTLDDIPGTHLAHGPFFAEDRHWGRPTSGGGGGGGDVGYGSAAGGATNVEVIVEGPAPIARYTDQTVVLFADGSVTGTTPGSLDDQRMWIDTANARDWTHSE